LAYKKSSNESKPHHIGSFRERRLTEIAEKVRQKIKTEISLSDTNCRCLCSWCDRW